MAGIRVIVCLSPGAMDDLAGALAEALAPFELFSGPEWRGIWDWWAIRGGSDGSGFSPLPGFKDDPRLIHDDRRSDGELLPSLPGMCAGGPRGLLDFSEFREMSSRMVQVRDQAGGPYVAHCWQPDVLTLDGWWIEDGLHPVHGICESAESCAHMAVGRQYQHDIGGCLEALANDVLLVKLKCHG